MLSPVCVRCRPLVAAPRQVLLSAPAAISGVRRCYSSTETAEPQKTSADNAQERKNAVIFSGIQPTGIPHLGNYLGAMRQWKRLQDKAKDGDRLLWSIVDLHAITMAQDGEALRMRKREMLAALLAIGLNPDKSHFFYQSSVPQHTELMWILSCTASMGYLSRMTQWKTKLQANLRHVELDDTTVAKLKLGLFSYPVLQAADILVHRATHVPVGDDQKQHLEFSRECVRNFNHAFGEVLIPPKTITTPSPRVMSLTNPNNKMSKSALNERSRILITAEEREIRQRVMGAVTDMETTVSWAPWRRPGVANLLELLAQCRDRRDRHRHQDNLEGVAAADEEARGGEGEGREDAEAQMKHSSSAARLAEEEFAGASLKALKESVADAVVAELAGIRDRYREVLGRRGGAYIDEVEAMGAAEARKSAEDTMRAVRRVVGLS
ncbi:tryptophanyl-tRNA synthetase [Biscogniauxia mediterranea]|nr:tryptophanyl-tRNA synthetase [Biscogniauxia mediterranea]